MTAPVHEALGAKDLLPEVHLVDAGYVDADLLIDAKAEHGIELVGPVRPDTSWQAKAGEGYDISAFQIDWDAQAVICPQGQKSVDWIPGQDRWGTGVVHIGFAKRTCLVCPTRSLCTRAKVGPREMAFRQPGRHEAIQAARQQQDTPEWRTLYGARRDRGLPVARRARLRPAPLAICRLGQDTPTACRDRSRAERRAAQRVGAGRGTGSNTNFTTGPPHGGLNRAAREFTNGISF